MKFPAWLKVYGDVAFRGSCPTEGADQITFFNWLPDDMRKLVLHPKNEGKRNHYQAARDKALGLTPGASDIILPASPAFVCELKRKDHTKSRWQPGQLDFLEGCYQIGAFVCVALGYEAAINAFTEWEKTTNTCDRSL